MVREIKNEIINFSEPEFWLSAVKDSMKNIGLTIPGNWSFEIRTKYGGFQVKSA